jgi:hypothetical protein
MRALHICAPYGKPPRGTQVVPPGTPCDRSGCDKLARGYLLFPWGATALCGPHLLEDMKPRPPRKTTPPPPMPTGFGFGSAHGRVGRGIHDAWKDGPNGDALVAPKKRRP